MAHENLRFNVLLRNGSSPTAVSQSSYNPIYADSYYGTHFGLFADFKPKDPNKNYGDNFELGKIALKIQNYTGAVSMGISSIISLEVDKAEDEFIVENFSTGRRITLSVCLQAMNTDFEKSVDLTELSQDFTFQEGDLLDVIVYIKPIDNKYSGIDNENRNEEALFVDELYMLRDGEDINVIKEKMEHRDIIKTLEGIGFKVIQDNKSNEFKRNLELLGGADRRCKLRNSDVYILK